LKKPVHLPKKFDLPERLVWAQQRPMQLQLVRQDERLTVTTVIGRSLLPTPNQPSYSA